MFVSHTVPSTTEEHLHSPLLYTNPHDVTDTPTADWDKAWMMGLRTAGYELGARSDEVRNSRSCEQHESMKERT